MDVWQRLQFFSPFDWLTVTLYLLTLWGIGLLIERPPKARPSVSSLMADYRRDWMQQMISRQPRIFDASILSTLRQGTTFYASACLIAIGGGLALIGNTERLLDVASDLSLNRVPAAIWEVKILLVVLVVTNALLKFIWSHRLFGYCAVVMAATPNDPKDPQARHRAAQAAEINISAARAFNRGLRSMYFALAGLAWLVGSSALLVATFITIWVLLRREFQSGSRQVLMQAGGHVGLDP